MNGKKTFLFKKFFLQIFLTHTTSFLTGLPDRKLLTKKQIKICILSKFDIKKVHRFEVLTSSRYTFISGNLQIPFFVRLCTSLCLFIIILSNMYLKTMKGFLCQPTAFVSFFVSPHFLSLKCFCSPSIAAMTLKNFPLFFTDAYMAAKSCTTSKNTPPVFRRSCHNV